MPRISPMTEADLPSRAWRTSVPVRFGQCDPAGIVYTPEYLDIFNGTIEDWYAAALGIPHHHLVRTRRTGLGYAHLSVDFMTPSGVGEMLQVAIILHEIGRSSFTMGVHAFKDGIECVRATFVSVTTSLNDHRPIAIPSDLRAALEDYLDRCERVQ
jgi:acyl-CoA thioesterase FadM